MIKRLRNKFRKWINTPPDRNDLFLTRIRKEYQKVFPCKHEWEEKEFRRSCHWCGDIQGLMYSRYGKTRYSWKSIRVKED